MRFQGCGALRVFKGELETARTHHSKVKELATLFAHALRQ